MKKILTNNWLLKIVSIILGILMWVTIINISDPTTKKTIKKNVEIINGELLTNAELAYSIEGGTVIDIVVSGRKSMLRNITADDIILTADLGTLWEVTGTIGIEYKIVNNESIIRNISLSRQTLKVITEPLQTKEFILIINTVGNVASGSVVGDISTTPHTVSIKGPQSLIGQVTQVGIGVDLEGLSSSSSGTASIILYDANNNKLESLVDKLDFSVNEIEYNIEILDAKEIPLIFEVTGDAADGYRYTGVTSPITNIYIVGIPDVVASLEGIIIKEAGLSVAGANSSVTVKVDINKYLPSGVSLVGTGERIIEVTLNVEKLQQKTFNYSYDDIEIINQSNLYEYTFMEQNAGRSVQVVVEGLESELEVLNIEQLIGSADVKDRTVGEIETTVDFSLDDKFNIVNVPKVRIIITEKADEIGSSISSLLSGDSELENTNSTTETSEVNTEDMGSNEQSVRSLDVDISSEAETLN
jgi:Uncharacterized protein conserved in bacteria